MSYPVVHVKLRHDCAEEVHKDVECLRFIEDLASVQFLNVKVLVDRDLNYTFTTLKLTAIGSEPNDSPEEV